jgi:uncharacterized protein Yka (UPF0111/DUF47 family)
MKRFFRKRRNRFLEYLAEQAEFMEQGLVLLLDYARQPDLDLAEQMVRLEKRADEVRRILIDELNKTFTTPIDREDIFGLSRALDDVLDYADTTVEEMALLEIDSNEHFESIVEHLLVAARNLNQAVHVFERDSDAAAEFALAAKAQENMIETEYRGALANLFKDPKDVDSIIGRSTATFQMQLIVVTRWPISLTTL